MRIVRGFAEAGASLHNIFAFKDFLDFFNDGSFLLLKDDQIFTRLSLEHKEFRGLLKFSEYLLWFQKYKQFLIYIFYCV
jgi:hypothetical protein